MLRYHSNAAWKLECGGQAKIIVKDSKVQLSLFCLPDSILLSPWDEIVTISILWRLHVLRDGPQQDPIACKRKQGTRRPSQARPPEHVNIAWTNSTVPYQTHTHCTHTGIIYHTIRDQSKFHGTARSWYCHETPFYRPLSDLKSR